MYVLYLNRHHPDEIVTWNSVDVVYAKLRRFTTESEKNESHVLGHSYESHVVDSYSFTYNALPPNVNYRLMNSTKRYKVLKM